MKILFLAPVPYFKHEGAHPAPWITTLISHLSKSDVQITMLNYSHHCTKDIETFYEGDIEYIFVKTSHPKINLATAYYSRIKKITKFINENQNDFDIIHIFGNEHQFEISLKKIHKPKLLHVQGIISEYKKVYRQNGFKRLMWYLDEKYEKTGYHYIDNYSCRTDWDEKIVKHYRPDAKIFKVWEMIRDEFFLYRKENSGKDILFIGGTNLIKGLNFGLQSFDKIKDITGGKFFIVGNSKKEIIKKIIRDHNLSIDIEKDLEIKGFLKPEEILKCYNECFCLLHPSIIDNSPNSICEAQVAGLPVIATNVGGVSSLIENNVNGILVNNDTNEIATKIVELFHDDSLRLKIAQNSIVLARERHDPQKIVKQTIKIYKEIA